MGSIHNLLNPLTPTPPQSYVLPRKSAIKEEEIERDDVVTLDADAECYTPVDMRASYEDTARRDDSGGAEAEDERIASLATENIRNDYVEQLRPSTQLSRTANNTPSPSQVVGAAAEAAGSRRTSSSSLADILNPVEELPIVANTITEHQAAPLSASHDSGPQSIAISITAETPPQESDINRDTNFPPSRHEIEDEAMVDVVGMTEDEQSVKGEAQQENIPMATAHTGIPLGGEPMKQSLSTDSERTITDIVEDSPGPTFPAPSTPSKKRKFTPESSPEEPLLHETLSPVNETALQESEIQNQIAVEKPQAPSRTSKKTKRAPIRRPPQPKKKGPNGQRKPLKPKIKELSVSVGFDDDTGGSSTRQSSIAPSIASESSFDSTSRGSKQLYCICRKPDQGEWMICCEACNEWFHGTCVKLEESDEPLIDTYICPICTEQKIGKTTWLRKCRLDGCKNPATPPVKGVKGVTKGTKGSKYCSDEHGTIYFQTKLRELDFDSITKEQLKTLLTTVGGVESFKSLGDEEPIIPDSILLKYKTPEDDTRLSDLRLEREKLLRKLDIVRLRQTFLHLAVEKAKQLNLGLKSLVPQQLSTSKNKPKVKAREICGFNEILSLDDAEFLEWSASEEGKRIFAEKRIEGDRECTVEKRRCRHTGWQGLRGEDIVMEESLLNNQLEGITRQEKIIRERQKVRARCGDPSNGRVIRVS